MILVTGATGNIGRAVVGALDGAGAPVCALVRDPAKAAERLPASVPLRVATYDQPEALEAAFAGVTRMVFVPSDGEALAVIGHHRNLIEAARRQHLAHTAFISIADVDDTSPFYFAPVYRETERLLRQAVLPHGCLRCNIYAEFLRDHVLEIARENGKIEAPLGKGSMAPVARADVAAAAASLVQAPELAGQSFGISGPRSYDGVALAHLATRAYGHQIGYAPMHHPDYLLRLWQSHPAPWPHAFSTMAQSISQGRYGALQDGVERLLGRAPVAFEDVLMGEGSSPAQK